MRRCLRGILAILTALYWSATSASFSKEMLMPCVCEHHFRTVTYWDPNMLKRPTPHQQDSFHQQNTFYGPNYISGPLWSPDNPESNFCPYGPSFSDFPPLAPKLKYAFIPVTSNSPSRTPEQIVSPFRFQSAPNISRPYSVMSDQKFGPAYNGPSYSQTSTNASVHKSGVSPLTTIHICHHSPPVPVHSKLLSDLSSFCGSCDFPLSDLDFRNARPVYLVCDGERSRSIVDPFRTHPSNRSRPQPDTNSNFSASDRLEHSRNFSSSDRSPHRNRFHPSTESAHHYRNVNDNYTDRRHSEVSNERHHPTTHDVVPTFPRQNHPYNYQTDYSLQTPPVFPTGPTRPAPYYYSSNSPPSTSAQSESSQNRSAQVFSSDRLQAPAFHQVIPEQRYVRNYTSTRDFPSGVNPSRTYQTASNYPANSSRPLHNFMDSPLPNTIGGSDVNYTLYDQRTQAAGETSTLQGRQPYLLPKSINTQ
ncbi:hypothetical protein AAG570_002451 [Ranatra chinensis]|uniref:Uncharacterized protein n=1 Tax=Ranatra chinensis TaxID=642074 RepID=A0ABD0Y807_9HEMI